MNILRRLLRRPLVQLSSLDAYALWAQSYAPIPHNRLMQLEENAMRELLPPLRDKDVLDLACGTGRYAMLAREQSARTVVAVDNSAPMLQQNEFDGRVQASLDAIPLADAALDVVLCGLALGHVANLDPALSQVSRILRPGGTLLLSDFHPYQYLAGARRTFQYEGRTYSVEHYVHHVAEYFERATAHDLRLTALREPVHIADEPVVLILRFEKIGSG